MIKESHTRRGINSIGLSILVSFALALCFPTAIAFAGDRELSTPYQTDPLKETLDRARFAGTVAERVRLLESFVSTHRGSPLENEAREALMREYALMGEQHLREGNPREALSAFRSVFRSAPERITDRIFGQFIFPLPMAMNAFGYRVEGVELMKSFERRFERDPNRLVQIGFFYVQVEAPIEAVRILEKAVALAPDDHRARNSLGTAYLINLRIEEATAQFEQALDLNPRDEYANLNLANVLRSSGNCSRAVEFYRKQIEVKSDDADAYCGAAICLFAMGHDSEGEQMMRRALELAPDDYRLLTQVAYFYMTRRILGPARLLLERAARAEPRYAWTHIAKANLDALEGKFGDALATIISAQSLAGFPTLKFELVKMLMMADGYDQAVEVLNEAFTVTEEGEFEAMLGGVVRARSPRLDLLLEKERQASIFLNEQLTTPLQYRLAEALGRIDRFSRLAVAVRSEAASAARRGGTETARGRRSPPPQPRQDPASATRPRRAAGEVDPGGELTAGADAGLKGMPELLRAITTFTTLDDGRQPFRMLWVARRLSEDNLALDAAEQLARRALLVADSATEPEFSMRDAPLLDREGRRRMFLGRAHDILGWILFRKGDIRGAIHHLSTSVESYPANRESLGAVWRLAVVMEESGDEQRALDFYIAGYDPDLPTAASRKSQIETLYRKVHGSLDGLEEKLGGR